MVPPAKRKYKIHDTATDLAGSHVMILSWAIGIGNWSDQGHRDGDYDWWLYKSIIVEKMTVQNVFLSFPSKYNILFFKCWSWIDLFVFNWQIFLWHSHPSSHLQSPYLCPASYSSRNNWVRFQIVPMHNLCSKLVRLDTNWVRIQICTRFKEIAF